jgi:hypothetical protein
MAEQAVKKKTDRKRERERERDGEERRRKRERQRLQIKVKGVCNLAFVAACVVCTGFIRESGLFGICLR